MTRVFLFGRNKKRATGYYQHVALSKYGGSAWESNPPTRLLTQYTGFEVREGHQSPFHFPYVFSLKEVFS